MAKYNYRAMTAAEFARNLDETGWTLGQFCRQTGYGYQEVREEWLTKQSKPIPHIVRVFFALNALPGGGSISRMITDAVIEKGADDFDTDSKREFGAGEAARERGNTPARDPMKGVQVERKPSK
jgi:hypothetical protein